MWPHEVVTPPQLQLAVMNWKLLTVLGKVLDICVDVSRVRLPSRTHFSFLVVKV